VARASKGLLLSLCLLSGLVVSLVSAPSMASSGNAPVDIRIGQEEGFGRLPRSSLSDVVSADRPAILIAWRNTARIRETELLIQNRAERAARARVGIQVLDADHRILAAEPSPQNPVLVDIPSASQGGRAGIVVKVPGRASTNSLFDQLDNAGQSYCIRAVIQPVGVADSNLADNSATKCYNNSARIDSAGNALFQYYLRNDSTRAVNARLVLTRSALPKGWWLEATPRQGSRVHLSPGSAMTGVIALHAPRRVAEGSSVDVRPTLLAKDGRVVDSSEYFATADHFAPTLSIATASPGQLISNDDSASSVSRSVYLNVIGGDAASGLAEAGGVFAEFSTDGGVTRNTRTLAYADGNFVGATRFETNLGPFPEGTKVTLNIVARDVVGNFVRTLPQQVTVPLRGQVSILHLEGHRNPASAVVALDSLDPKPSRTGETASAGLLALIAALTFVVWKRRRSVSRGLARHARPSDRVIVAASNGKSDTDDWNVAAARELAEVERE